VGLAHGMPAAGVAAGTAAAALGGGAETDADGRTLVRSPPEP